MRTTLTLEPDIAANLRSLARERGVPFKQVVNEVLRAGLASRRQTTRQFVQQTHPLGLRGGAYGHKLLQLAADLEDEETVRKLELRK